MTDRCLMKLSEEKTMIKVLQGASPKSGQIQQFL